MRLRLRALAARLRDLAPVGVHQGHLREEEGVHGAMAREHRQGQPLLGVARGGGEVAALRLEPGQPEQHEGEVALVTALRRASSTRR